MQSVHEEMAAIAVAMEMAGVDGLWQLRNGIWESHQSRRSGKGKGELAAKTG